MCATAGAVYMSEPEWDQAWARGPEAIIQCMEQYTTNMVGSAHRTKAQREALEEAAREWKRYEELMRREEEAAAQRKQQRKEERAARKRARQVAEERRRAQRAQQRADKKAEKRRETERKMQMRQEERQRRADAKEAERRKVMESKHRPVAHKGDTRRSKENRRKRPQGHSATWMSGVGWFKLGQHSRQRTSEWIRSLAEWTRAEVVFFWL